MSAFLVEVGQRDGLQGMGYKSHYDKMFGEGAWDKGNNAGQKLSHATAKADDNGNEE